MTNFFLAMGIAIALVLFINIYAALWREGGLR